MKRFLLCLLTCIMIISCLAACDMPDADKAGDGDTTPVPSTNQNNNTDNQNNNTDNQNNNTDNQNNNTDANKFDLRSSEDLYAEWESCTEPSVTGYTVHIKIITPEDKEITDSFSISNLQATYGYTADKAYSEHKRLEKEYFLALNTPIAEKLGLNKYNCYASDYSAFISIRFDSIEEYAACEDEILTSIRNNTDILASAKVYLSYSVDIGEG